MHKQQTCNECKCDLKHVTSTVSLTCFYAGKGVLKKTNIPDKMLLSPLLIQKIAFV